MRPWESSESGPVAAQQPVLIAPSSVFVLQNWNNIRTVIVHIIPSVHNSIGEIFYLRLLPSAAPNHPHQTNRNIIIATQLLL